ncbi:MAG: right-handed parallel beta-helix repeat-containing protein [Saprospiraceae bacterium]|nr:right-handed parallel beta-helix repeat-containing protein [Saprospiraceae bacterium]
MNYFLPVHNLTQNTYHQTIGAGIAAANASDVLELAEWTFNERVVVDKPLTIQGVSKVNTIITGTGLAGTGSGMTLNNGVANVTIKTSRCRTLLAVANGSAGIYAVGGNDNLTIDNTIIKDNLGGSGFYANGPISNVLIDDNTVSGHTNVAGAARGIVIWNGLKQNITITNNEVFGNNCCGIELQDGSATGVTITGNNVHDNADNGIGVVGLMGPGANTVSGNTVTDNGRFGIEIKNPNGNGMNSGAGSILVNNNTVTRSIPIVDARDIAGIAVFRRGVIAPNVDVPYGAYVSNNTVSGYTQPSTSEGFGIVVEGINHTVANNNVSGCDVGIQRQAGHTPYPGDGDQSDVVDTYFGRGNSPYSCGITLTGNILTNTIDTRDVGTVAGVGYVTNGITLERFCTIQSAIDDASTLAGHTLAATAATYNEDVIVSKAVTLQGAGYATTTISGPIGGGGSTVQVAAAGAVIEGFTITRDGNNVTDWNSSLNSAGVAIQSQGNWAEIRNCNIYGNRTGIDVNNSNGNNIHNNIIDFNRTGLLFRNQTDNTNLTENTITNNWTVGVLFLDASVGTNSPVQTAINSNFNDNNISGNWYGEVVDRQSGGSLPLPGTTNLKDFECNWYGAATYPVISTANSAEPGYAAQIPVAFGGSATPPGGQPDILGAASANIDFISWLVNGTDDQPATIGFQPVAGQCLGTPVLITSVVVDDIICGEPSGSITVTFAGGTMPHDIAWTGGSASMVTSPYVISGLAAGPYSITVTSANGSTATASATVQYLPVTNTTDGLYFATIQQAIDASTTGTGDVIDVCAGTYVENVIVSKSVSLNGPNAAISPNSGMRAPEAVLVPASTNTSTGAIVTITASNASVKGFKMDGDNPSLASSGVGLGGAHGLSNDAARGIFINANGVSGITVAKNIATKLENGIRIEQTTNYFATTSGAQYSHSILIDDNKVENVRSTGIRLGNSMFAKVTNNTVTNAENGIAFNSFRIKDMGNAADRVIENNTISARFAGIWTNLFHTSPYAINNNAISVAPEAPVDANPAYAARTTWYGIKYATVSAPQNFTSQTNLPLVGTPEYWTCNNNTIDGGSLEPTSTGHGYWLYYVDNNRDGSSVDNYGQISGGSVSNVDIGVFLKNRDTDPATNYGTAAVGAHAGISGVSFSLNAGGTAIKMKDDASWTSSNPAPLINKRTVALNLGSGVTIANGAKGIVLDYPDPATVGFTPYDAITGATLNNLAFTGQTGNYVEMLEYNRNLDGLTATFDGITGAAATVPQLYSIENKVLHDIDDSDLGYVSVKANTTSVTQTSFSAPATTTPSIQRAINALGSAGTVNVEGGATAYTGGADASSKDINLNPGSSPGCVPITGNLTLDGGDVMNMEINSATACTGYDQFTVSGTVTLGGASLNLTLGYTPSSGDVITLIDGTSAVVGQFAQGATITVGGYVFAINYAGGDGFDVVLTSCGTGTVHNTSYMPNRHYCKIQDAINDALTGHTIVVDAGTYVENIVVNKELDIRGANYNVNPNTGMRGPESILMTAIVEVAGSNNSRIVAIDANNVSINGFLIDGNNPALTSGFLNNVGADMDIRNGIDNAKGIQNLRVENNIIKNIVYYGVRIQSTTGLSPAVSSGHEIHNNRIMDMGTYQTVTGGWGSFGGGVLLQNSHYAKVTNNVMLNVRIGVQLGNFQVANPGAFAHAVENNQIQARRIGIFYNLLRYSPWTVAGNAITGYSSTDEQALGGSWRGLRITSVGLAGMGNSLFTNNTVDGSAITLINKEGINVWNVTQNSMPIISGGSITGVNTGVLLTNHDASFGNGADGAHATLTNMNISAAGVGVHLLDSPSSTTHANVQVTATNNFITGGVDGLKLEEAVAGKVTGTATTNSITGQSGFAINATSITNLVAATCNWYGSNVPATVATKISGAVTYAPFLLDGIDDDANPGNGFQHATCGNLVVVSSATPTHILCGPTTGSIEVAFTGGDATFDIAWSGVSSGSASNITNPYTITPLLAGTYTVTVTSMNGSTSTATATIQYLPVTNTTDGMHFATIQAAINAAATDDIITVCAGTYAEQLTINKKLDIRGPNFGIAGNGMRNAEAIIVPPSELNTSLPREWSTVQVVEITADGAKMDGFTISGDNTSINGYSYAGMNIEAGRGVRSAANDVTFTNNIVEKFTYIGFNAVGGLPSPTYKNLVLTGNKFDQIHDLTQLGYGFAMYIQATAGAITNNVVTNSRAGIQIQPYQVVQGTNGVSTCNNNDFAVWTRGIYYNYAEVGASAWTIDGNEITAVNPPANPTGPVLWQGIRAETMRSSGNGGTISNNTVNGAGVAIDNVKWWGNWALEYRGQASTSNQVFFTGNTVTNVEIGFVHNALADIVLTGNNLSATNKAISIQRQYTSAGVQEAIGGTNNINATGGNTINGIATAGASTNDLFTVEDAINHKIDNSIQGLVRVKANELFVTENSFGGYVSPTTTMPSIQRAVDIAATAETINVNSGNYNEQVLINKGLSLVGSGPTMPIVNFTGTPALASGKLTLFEVTAPNVTIYNFQFEVDLTKLGSAVLASSPTLNNLTVTNNEINPYRSAPTSSFLRFAQRHQRKRYT